MILFSKCLIGFVALQHIGFMVLEMFLWTHPIGMKVFRQSAANAEITKVLAGNQGLYNGFLAAGLIWALLHADAMVGRQIAYFFLGCVIVAGAYGAWSVSPRILLVQAGPAILAVALLCFSSVTGNS
jgi:putative membrane protein